MLEKSQNYTKNMFFLEFLLKCRPYACFIHIHVRDSEKGKCSNKKMLEKSQNYTKNMFFLEFQKKNRSRPLFWVRGGGGGYGANLMKYGAG